jgi:aryl-alcohol dehydrogenase-like predicted oxidoreductase
MRTTALGARGPEVSVIGFGAWAIGGRDWGPPQEDAVSRVAIQQALDDGVTFLDTADVYGHGHSEELIADVLRERGDATVFVATKAGNDFYNATAADDHGYGPIRNNIEPDYLRFAVERSLRRLRTDRLDLLQLHSPPTALLERDEPWRALEDLKREGKIRLAGWSIQSFRETEQAPLLERHADVIDVIQVRYNLLEREAEQVLLPTARRLGTGVIVRIPLLFGLLAGKFDRTSTFGPDDHRRFNLAPDKLPGLLDALDELGWLFDLHPDQTKAQVALRFVLSHPACHVAIPGGRRRGQVVENDRAGALEPLPPAVLARLGVHLD